MHFKYLKYVLKHKLYVYRAGREIGVPIWRLLKHDWSKFLLCEWFPYARYFYAGGCGEAFLLAWLHHQKVNDHHWQYWCCISDTGIVNPIPMPRVAVLEMVADWIGANKAIAELNKRDWTPQSVWDWYVGKDLLLHPDTRDLLEDTLHRWLNQNLYPLSQ